MPHRLSNMNHKVWHDTFFKEAAQSCGKLPLSPRILLLHVLWGHGRWSCVTLTGHLAYQIVQAHGLWGHALALIPSKGHHQSLRQTGALALDVGLQTASQVVRPS